MFEESVEGFVQRWRAHVSAGTAFARFEGSPLLEVAFGDVVVQLFERTGPYLAPAGPVHLIVHAVADSWSVADAEGAPQFEAVGPARLRVAGTVLEREGRLVVLDAGVRVVLGLEAGAVEGLPEVGGLLRCETLAPAQAFVVPRPAQRSPVASTDDLV